LRKHHIVVCLTVLCLTGIGPRWVRGQDTGQTSPVGEVALNFPADMELSVLVEYVSQRLGINILYDEQVANKRLTIRAPQQVPASSLIGLLESALMMKGLALVDTPDEGFKKIIATKDILNAAISPSASSQAVTDSNSIAVTQVFKLFHGDMKYIEQAIKPYLSKPGGNVISVPGQNLLIVSDMASNVRRIADLIQILDKASPALEIAFIGVRYADSKELATRIKQLMQVRQKAAGRGADAGNIVEVLSDPRTNQLVVIAKAHQIDEIRKVVLSLDLPLQEDQSPVQFYKLYHRAAKDVLDTLLAIQGDEGMQVATVQSLFETESATTSENYSTTGGESPPPPAKPIPTDQQGADATAIEDRTTLASEADRADLGASQLEDRRARVAADVHTNSIIVVAPPPVQRVYEALIRKLDERRPQVLLEATVVALDTSDDFNLGVEISISGSPGDARIFSFGSFGLSTPSATTGDLTPLAGTGLNFALINADVADVVLRALKRTGRAEVLSAPKVLVNDNETGTLTATAQEPFESVNASDTVATTSFGGFVEAGTNITLTPHISSGDYLQLEYAIELSSFSGERVNNLPPPRQQDTIESSVTVPNGHTIIVGGLKRRDFRDTITRIPWLGEIPIIEYLFRNQIKENNERTLFVFVRPTILRDDEFRDLMFLSQRDLGRSKQPGDYPPSEPMVVR